MSKEMQEFEQVSRHQGYLGTQHDKSGDEMWVTSDDYDALLAYTRTLMHQKVKIERDMVWMHVSCEPDNCHTSGTDCTGGVAVKLYQEEQPDAK